MTNGEIREAISATKEIAKWLDGDSNGRHYNILVALAEEYLKVEGWPEEQSCNCPGNVKDIYCTCGYEQFNAALRLCKLAVMKEKSRIAEAGEGGKRREMKKLTKKELIKKLKQCANMADTESAHIEADDLLLQYINDEDIMKVWNEVSSEFWYA